MVVRVLHSSIWIAQARLHVCSVTFLVRHRLGAGERLRAAGLTRAALVAKSRAPVGRSLRLWFAGLLRHWHSCTSALTWSPMPPFNRQHRLRQLHLGAPGWLALASSAVYNRSINTDAQMRPLASLAPCSCAGYLQR
jgi:hypothetical protein